MHKEQGESQRHGEYVHGLYIDIEGTVAIASGRQDGQRGEERKVDLIVREMKRHNVKVVGLQETKWFGCDVYGVGGSVVLASGRPLPDAGNSYQ